MPWNRAFVTIAACFGLGLALSHTMPVAHATSCILGSVSRLELRGIEGDGAPAAEQEFWQSNAWISESDSGDYTFKLDGEPGIRLRKVQ